MKQKVLLEKQSKINKDDTLAFARATLLVPSKNTSLWDR
jgi:hypothetical protein